MTAKCTCRASEKQPSTRWGEPTRRPGLTGGRKEARGRHEACSTVCVHTTCKEEVAICVRTYLLWSTDSWRVGQDNDGATTLKPQATQDVEGSTRRMEERKKRGG